MCYRYNNTEDEREFRRQLKAHLPSFKLQETGGRFSFNHTNGFFHDLLPVITMEDPTDITYKHWGLIPSCIETELEKKALWNDTYCLTAKSEKVHYVEGWKESIRNQRCLVPATGFFAWRDYEGIKYPYYIQVIHPEFPCDTADFCFAGIYDSWSHPETGEVLETFALITTEGNEIMKQIDVNPMQPDNGGRMPVIVKPKDYATWLNPSANFEQLETIMKPLQCEIMRAYTIRKDVSRPEFNFEDPGFMIYTPYDSLPESAWNLAD